MSGSILNFSPLFTCFGVLVFRAALLPSKSEPGQCPKPLTWQQHATTTEKELSNHPILLAQPQADPLSLHTIIQ